MPNALKAAIKKLPFLSDIFTQRDNLHAELNKVSSTLLHERAHFLSELGALTNKAAL